MLLRNGFTSQQNYNATVVMYCSGTQYDQNGDSIGTYVNTHKNTTPTTAHVMGKYDGNQDTPSILDVEPCPAEPVYDVNVTAITIPSSTLYVNKVNGISALIWNNGTETISTSFDVTFDDAYGLIDTVTVDCTTPNELAPSENRTVLCDFTPSCSNYPLNDVSFPAKSLPVTIDVSVLYADSNMANNNPSQHVPALAGNILTGVVNNGYMSKNFDCDPEDPLTLVEHYDLTGGGVEYNVSGESFTLEPPSDPDNNTVTRSHGITLPSGATVVDARLYLYTNTNHGYYNQYAGGATSNLNVDFNGSGYQPPDVVYDDSKGFGGYLMNRRTAVFNVTSLMNDESYTYNVVVKNIDPSNHTSLYGGKLVVVYEGADHGDKVEIVMLEGADWLYKSSRYGTSVAEATGTSGFGALSTPLGLVDSAELITEGLFLGSRGAPPNAGANLLFNGEVIKEDAWCSNGWAGEEYLGSRVFMETVDVTDDLSASNNMAFQDEAEHLTATGAILVVKKKPASVGTSTGSGTAYFKSDAGVIDDLTAIAEGTLPDAGKPNLLFPHGFFSFNITGLANLWRHFGVGFCKSKSVHINDYIAK
jgi:hypothetical protein